MPRFVALPFSGAALLIAAPAVAQTTPTPAPTPATPTVTVTGQRTTDSVSIDRKSYDITRDLQGATGSIGDVLRNLPSVDVDLGGNVSLRGDGNVVILVDGKPTGLFRGPGGGQMLTQVPADQFERVEVMTNPGAAFAADGSGGVINLIRRRDRKPGLSGTARIAQGTGGRWSTGASANRKAGKLTLSLDGTYRRDPQHSRDAEHFTLYDASRAPTLDAHQLTTGDGMLHLWTAHAGADYDLDPTTHIGAEIRQTTFDYHADFVEHLMGTGPGGATTRLFDRNGFSLSNRGDSEASLSFRRTLPGSGHAFTASLTHERVLEDRRQTYADQDVLPAAAPSFENLTARNTLNRTELKLDYTGPMAAKAKLAMGFDLQGDDDVFDNRGGRGPDAASAAVPGALYTNLFRYTQTIAALYASYERPFGDVTVQAGLRLETQHADIDQATSGRLIHRADTRLFPSLHLAWTIDGDDTLRLAATERVQRPAPADYNPFRVFGDPFHYSEGNPNLVPQVTWSGEAGIEHKTGSSSLQATFYYRRNRHGVTDVLTDLGGGVLLTSRANLSNSSDEGVELVASMKPVKTLSVKLSGNVYHSTIDATDLGLTDRRSAWIVSGKGSVDWQPSKRDLAQVSASMIGKRLIPQGFYEPMLLVNLGYRHKLNARLWAFVTAQDALHTYQAHATVATAQYRSHTDDSARTQAAFIGLSYNFGGGSAREPGFDYGR